MLVKFVDTTIRDGAQSLWASSIRTGMIEAIAEDLDQAGFDSIEVPVNPIYFKKFIRDLKEDPWSMVQVLAEKIPNTPKACIASATIHPFEASPRSIVKLFYRTLANKGALDRVQLVGNTFDQTTRTFPWFIPFFKELNVKVAIALSYTISPRHSDEYYGEKVKEFTTFKPDIIYLKDQGGILTVDRLRSILPSIVANANGIPVEIHTHCTTGLADVLYMEALKLGVNVVHTALPPLANGSSQPSVFSIGRNARQLGYELAVDLERLQHASDKLTEMAQIEGMPIGTPTEYNAWQYEHQVPGGVISNLWHQLKSLKLDNRIDEVIEESIQVRKDLGYPIMITPFSQFVVSQSAINVALGERYKVVIDELIAFALGHFGEDSGYTWMDQNLKDKFLSLPRAKEVAKREHVDMPLEEIRESLGGPSLSDEELLLRYIMKGEQEIKAMRAAGPYKRYFSTSSTPLITLIEELGKQKQVKYVQIGTAGQQIILRRRSNE